MEAAVAPQERTEFLNQDGGVVGYVRINTKTGEEIGDIVRPGETVWMTDAEIEATHRAPRTVAGSPFVEREVERSEEMPVDSGKGDGSTVVRTRTWTETLPPLLKKIQRGMPPVFSPDEVTAAEGGAQGPAPEGSFADGEEAGTQV